MEGTVPRNIIDFLRTPIFDGSGLGDGHPILSDAELKTARITTHHSDDRYMGGAIIRQENGEDDAPGAWNSVYVVDEEYKVKHVPPGHSAKSVNPHPLYLVIKQWGAGDILVMVIGPYGAAPAVERRYFLR